MPVQAPQPEREHLLSAALYGSARAGIPARSSARGAVRRVLALLAAMAGVCALAGAQTAQFAGYETTLPLTGGSSPQPVALAVDAAGDVFVSDMANDAVVKLTPSGNSYAQSTIADSTMGLVSPRGIAVDASGNVYIADYGGQQIYEVPWNGSVYGTPVALMTGIAVSPADLTVNAYGYLFFTNRTNNNVYYLRLASAPGTPSILTQAAGLSQPLGILYEAADPAHPTNGNGALFLGDFNSSTVSELPFTGGAWGTLNPVPATGLNKPARLAQDANGNLYIADFGNNRVVEVPWSGSAWQTQVTVPGSTLASPEGVATDASGDLYIADTFNNRVLKDTRGTSANLGTVAVGGSSTGTLYFQFTSDATLGSVAVLTQGAAGLDFAAASDGTCAAGSYHAGDVCSVKVTFAPQHPGARAGAVLLEDGSGNVLGEALLAGVGQGPSIVFAPGTESTIAVSGASTPQPVTLAVDAGGNVYISDAANGQVVKETPSGSGYTQSVVASGLGGPRGVAVDGAGNVYIADFGGHQLYEAPWNGSTYGPKTPLLPGGYAPAGVAVDASGNVFFTSWGDAHVYELSGGTATALAGVTGMTQPAGLAFDAAGDLFITDYSANKVVELPWSGSAWGALTPVIASGLSNPSRIAVDAAGSLYFADAGNNRVVEAPRNGSGWGSLVAVETSTLNSPQGVALDGDGNLYIADYGNSRALKEDLADAPSLSFADTIENYLNSSDSPRTVTAANIGNATLTFPLPASGNNPSVSTNFLWDSASTCAQTNSGAASAFTLASGASCTIAIDFAPTTTGNIAGSAVLTDDNLNAAGPAYATQTIQLSGVGLPQPTAFVAPSSASFSNQVQGTTSNAWTFTLNNTGGLNLIGITMSFTGANPSNFAIAGSSCGTTLAPYSTCTFEVTFTPSITSNASDSYSANLVVDDDAVGHPQVVSLSGTGIGMTVLLNPNPVNFGTQTAGSTSSTQSVILANAGSGTLTISGIGLSGVQASAFNIVGTTCGPLPIPGGGVTLGSNQSCTITMNFTPSSSGSYSAVLNVYHNGNGGNPQSVTLNGTGQGQSVQLSPTTVNFANQTVGSTSNPWTVTFNNTSDQPLTGVGVSIVGATPADFAETSNCGSTLAAHTTCNILVSFKPQSATYFSATLQVASSASTQTAALSGTGTAVTATLAPNQLNFGSLPQHTTSPAQPATLTNTSDGPLDITGINITSDSAEFAISSNGCTSPLAAHATCQIYVTYTPQNTGSASGTLTVNDSGSGSPRTVSLVGVGTSTTVSGFLSPGAISFGSQAVGSTSNAWGMTLNNTGSTAMTGLTIYMSGLNPGDFAETNSCGNSLAANSTCSIQVTFKPQAAGSRSGTLIAAYTSGSGGSFHAGLTGTGTGAAPTVLLSPGSLNFGNQTVNVTSSPQTATLTNTSAGPVNISSVGITSGAVAFAVVSNSCGSTLAAYTSCAIGITFKPQTAAYAAGTLTITDSASGGQQTLALSGTGTSNTPTGYFSPNSISFGNQAVGSTSNAWGMTLNNSSNVAMSGLTLGLTGTDPGDFHILSSNCGSTLGANATCSFQVTFGPTALNSRSATLTATFTAGSGGTFTASLAGNGTAPTVSVAPSSVNFGNVTYGGQSSEQMVTLSNTSAGVLTGISYSTGSGVFVVDGGASTCGTTLAAYSSCAIAVYFKPATAISYNGTLTIHDSASGGQQTVGLSGTGQLAPQTITFTPLSSPVTFGVGPLPLSATSTSGLTVTFNVLSGPGSISGNSLVVTGAGSIMVAANQGGDSNYAPAPQVTQTVVASPATPVVTTWPTASGITAGQALSASTLTGGVASVPGTFTWTDGSILPGTGTDTEGVTFTPTDSTDYAPVTGTVQVTVTAPASPLIHASTFSLLASPSSLKLRAGQSGTVSLALVPSGGYKGMVALSCPSLPSGVSCSFSAPSLTADGHNTVTTSQLTISTVGLSASVAGGRRTGGSSALAGILLLPGLFFGCLLMGQRRKLSAWAKHLLVIGMIASALAGLTGCGGMVNFTNTLSGTHSITLAAKASSATGGATSTQTGNLTVTITQ